MKFQTTKKAMRGDHTYAVGYCDLQFLLNYESPIAYSAGVYGWSCDYYEVGNIIISTGYSPIGKPIDYALSRKYDNKAREIICGDTPYEKQRGKIQRLLKKFVKEVEEI